ncbi:AmpG family muropeptide MFS transporter [Desulforhabdus amnigena]|uniref:Integral membrane signal transducer protein n=1 Tax=Desulforhabdus amnigena TaxID=40218 RepID=A0A9W6FTR3_9BACT|nr:AmpG family muropeptide MFS transporter [Desulforhabdus amnigena]NLJ26885.1 AmpG family muropeptide MFS transporter [Deltaproteobacteria bacterium]GLI33936.1 integral membrane signal transducer protein [Desulforhabdus amnigena]
MQNWLKVYGNRRVLSLLGLGFSSGLPLALTASTLQAWMATEKVDLALIGIFSLVGLPYTLKVLWAPVMDRFTPPFLGRRRGWIVITQVLLALAILALSLASPASMPWLVAFLAVMIAFFSSSQDIVVDAYRADVLQERELGAGAATTVVGYRIALIVSGAVAMILSDHLPWRAVYGLMAVLMLLNVAFTLAAPEPAERVVPPKTIKEAVWGPLASYFRRSGAVEMLCFIMLYKLGDAVAGAMTTPFLLDLGFTRTDVGTVNKAFGLISTILGTLAGGSIIAKMGINRSLWLFAFLQAFSNLAFTGLALVGKSYAVMVTAIGLENICGGMGTAAFVAFMMSLCDKRFTATQYALLTSFMAVTRVLAGVPTGFMVNSLGWAMFYSVSVLGALPGILLLPRFAPWNGGEGRGYGAKEVELVISE